MKKSLRSYCAYHCAFDLVDILCVGLVFILQVNKGFCGLNKVSNLAKIYSTSLELEMSQNLKNILQINCSCFLLAWVVYFTIQHREK